MASPPQIQEGTHHDLGTTGTGARENPDPTWLESYHTFSFNRYYDPRYTGFRDLLVINEDTVAPSRGFGTHEHQDMEIISYVVEGQLRVTQSTSAEGAKTYFLQGLSRQD